MTVRSEGTMLARWLLVLLLLINPARGVIAETAAAPPALPACAAEGACCPLCEAAGACPCASAPETPGPEPAPAAPSAGTDLPRMAPAPEPALWSERAPVTARFAAAAGHGSRLPAATVGAFLSVICVWTT